MDVIKFELFLPQFPVPLSEMLCGDPVALSVKTTVALKDPVVVGANTSDSEQLAPAPRVAPQLLVCRKEPAFVPEI